MYKLIAAAAAIAIAFAATGGAHAFQMKGTVADVPEEFSAPLVEGLAASGLATEDKIRGIVATDMAVCKLHAADIEDEDNPNWVGATATLRCPDGLRTVVAVATSSAGLRLKPGECTEAVDVPHLRNFFGGSTATTVCYNPHVGRVRYTIGAKVPRNYAAAR